MTRLSLSLIQALPKAKSKASHIAELLPEIEEALAAGYSHQAIFEQVKNTTGLELTFGYYENTIHRIRQRVEAKAKSVTEPPAAAGQKSPPLNFSTIKATQSIGAPTSKLQAALSEAVDDFFS